MGWIDTVTKWIAGKPQDDFPNSATMQSALSARVFRANGTVEDRGVVARKCVTNEGAYQLALGFTASGSCTIYNFKYHCAGYATAAETLNDTQAAITNAAGCNSIATGTQLASLITPHALYRTVGTINFGNSFAITEHGIIDGTTKASAKLWDRSVFGAITVASGDSIEFTYDLTIQAGG